MNENVLIKILLVIVIAVAIYYRLNQHKIKGRKGESRVARRLRKLRSKNYVVLNDILLKTSRGSSQIDHIVVSVYGVFVIETKNYSGWIHGHENSEYWSQSIYKKKRKFRNPIKQNWAHIYALKETLSEFIGIKYFPIVVFTGSAELKNVTSEIPVIYEQKLIRIFKKERLINLSVEQVNNIVIKIEAINLRNKKAKREHVRKVKNQASKRKQAEKSKVCPRCGHKLVLRNGKYGKFYGCSNYPKCKYILKK